MKDDRKSQNNNHIALKDLTDSENVPFKDLGKLTLQKVHYVFH